MSDRDAVRRFAGLARRADAVRWLIGQCACLGQCTCLGCGGTDHGKQGGA